MKRLYIVVLLAIFFSANSLQAQEDLRKTVQVVKPYDPSVSDAYKISRLPRINDTVKIIPTFEYTLQSKPMVVNYELMPIAAAKMVGEPLTKLYGNYLKIGLGTKYHPEIAFYANKKRSKEYQYGAYINHLSSYAKINLTDDVRQYAGFSNSNVGVFGKRIFNKSVVEGELSLLRDMNHFYGYDTQIDTTFEDADIRQRFFGTQAGLSWYSTHVDSSHLNYHADLNYRYFQDDFSFSENNLQLKGSVEKYFNAEMGGVDVAFHTNMPSAELDSSNNNLFSLNPWVGKFGEKWRVKAGVNLMVDSYNGKTETYVFPTGRMEFDIVNHIIIPYAGIDGGLEMNNYFTTIRNNPYVVPGTHIRNQDNKVVLYGGLKGNFSSTTYYNIKFEHAVIDNMAFFVNEYTATGTTGNQFKVVYDEVERNRFYGELSVTPSEAFTLQAKGVFTSYTTTTIDYPWHKDKLRLSFSGLYDLRDKILVRSELLVRGQRDVLNANGEAIELASDLSLNLGLEYRYSKILSGYLQVNNLLASENYLWQYYRTFGFNVMAGITYAF